MHRIRNLVVIVVALAAVVGISVAVHGGAKAPTVTVERVSYGDFQKTLPESGFLLRSGVVAVPALVGGNVHTLYVRPGDHVRAGELLATIDNPSLESQAASARADYASAVADVRNARIDESNAKVQYAAQLTSAKSALDLARRTYQADRALFTQQAVPRSQVDADRAKLIQAQASYDQALRQYRLGAVVGYGAASVLVAQANARKARILVNEQERQLSYTRVVAPEDGEILAIASDPSDPTRSIREGDPVTPGQALFTLAPDGGWVVKAQIDEQDVQFARVGQPARVSGADFGSRTFTGRVTAIEPVARAASQAGSTARQVPATITLDTSAPFFKDGMSADVDILTVDLRHVLVLSLSSILREKNGTAYVYVVQNGVLKRRSVVTGPHNDLTTVVRSGLRPGMEVVIHPDASLTSGMHVTVATPSPRPSSDEIQVSVGT
jgi:RND family efflux transporter MFP subunit